MTSDQEQEAPQDPYEHVIAIAAKAQAELVKQRWPVTGYISDLISASRKLINLKRFPETEAIARQRKYYLDQIRETLPCLEAESFPAGAAPLATELIAATNAAIAPPPPPTKPQVKAETPVKAETK